MHLGLPVEFELSQNVVFSKLRLRKNGNILEIKHWNWNFKKFPSTFQTLIRVSKLSFVKEGNVTTSSNNLTHTTLNWTNRIYSTLPRWVFNQRLFATKFSKRPSWFSIRDNDVRSIVWNYTECLWICTNYIERKVEEWDLPSWRIYCRTYFCIYNFFRNYLSLVADAILLFPSYNPVITSFNIHNQNYKKSSRIWLVVNRPDYSLNRTKCAPVLIYVTETEKQLVWCH